jgi:hypothetical protein
VFFLYLKRTEETAAGQGGHDEPERRGCPIRSGEWRFPERAKERREARTHPTALDLSELAKKEFEDKAGGKVGSSETD